LSQRKAVVIASALASVAAACAIGVPVAAGSGGSVKLAGTASRAATSTPRVGAVAPSSTVDFEVVLNLNDAAGAQTLARAVSTPGSGSYGKFLTPAAWERRFSPSESRVAAVVSFLRSSGFKQVSASPDRLAIRASGTAAQVERAFATSLSYHKVLGRTLRLADRDVSVPAGLAHVVVAVTGLTQTLARPNLTTDDPASALKGTHSIVQPPGFRAAPPCSEYYGQKVDTTLPPYGHGYPSPAPWAVCGYKPGQFRSAYNLSGPADGKGVTVAIVDAYTSPTLFADAHKFASINDPSHPFEASQFSELPASSYNLDDVCGAPGWFGEETLDVEAVHGTAPGANILFAGAQNCNDGPLNDSIRSILDGHRAEVITNSYGDPGGDVLTPDADQDVTNQLLLMAAGTGVSVMFSSGDSGDEFTTLGVVVPDFPASSPWATAVGGTTLQIGASGQRLGEFGWSTARSFFCSDTWLDLGNCTKDQKGTWLPIDLALDGGSGGGTSYHYAQPFYQAGVVPASLSERNEGVVGRGPKRVEPDISMEADPATGMLVGETQTFPNGVYYDQYRIGGTSVASPLFAGVIARADQQAGHSLGFLNPRLYSLYGNSSALYDVLPAGKQDMSRADYVNSIDPSNGFFYTTRIIDYEGTEQFCESAAKCHNRDVALNTARGFDSMTGLGSPGNAFVNALSAP